MKGLLANINWTILIQQAIVTLGGLVGLYWKLHRDNKSRKTVNKEGFEKLSKELAILSNEINENRKDTKRLELQAALDHKRSKQEVGHIYDQYVGLGGNSYMQKETERYLAEELEK